MLICISKLVNDIHLKRLFHTGANVRLRIRPDCDRSFATTELRQNVCPNGHPHRRLIAATRRSNARRLLQIHGSFPVLFIQTSKIWVVLQFLQIYLIKYTVETMGVFKIFARCGGRGELRNRQCREISARKTCPIIIIIIMFFFMTLPAYWLIRIESLL